MLLSRRMKKKRHRGDTLIFDLSGFSATMWQTISIRIDAIRIYIYTHSRYDRSRILDFLCSRSTLRFNQSTWRCVRARRVI